MALELALLQILELTVFDTFDEQQIACVIGELDDLMLTIPGMNFKDILYISIICR